MMQIRSCILAKKWAVTVWYTDPDRKDSTMNEEWISTIAQSLPALKFAGHFNGLSPLWDYSYHQHPYIEFIYHLNGKGARNVLDTRQDFSIFDAVVYPANCPHQDESGPNPDNEVYCLWVDIPCFALEQPLKVQDNNCELENLFCSIYNESKQLTPCNQLISLMIRVLFIQVIRVAGSSATTSIDRILQYLTVHMAQQVFLEELAEMEHISKSFLTKQFKAKTGMTIVQYVHALRMKTAKRLLVTTDKSVEEIALEVGFDSPKYFFRLFKETEHTTPNLYRKKSRQDFLNNANIL